MIIPGQTTLELLIGPTIYAIALYIVPPLFSALSAWVGDALADESMRQKARNVIDNVTPESLQEIYEFEHISQPIGAGLLAGIIVIYSAIPFGISLEAAIPLAILTGLASRRVLGTAAASFVAQRKA